MEAGGLGFKKSKTFNRAMLAKLAWMVASKRDSPCIRALYSKYKVKEDWLRQEPRKNASSLWKAIENLKGLIRKGACFRVGNGKSIDVWKDPWVPWIEGFIPTSRDTNSINSPLLVANLIDSANMCWKIEVVAVLFDLTFAKAISRIILPTIPQQDQLIWTPDPSGLFSVKSMFRLSSTPIDPQPNPTWQKLWKLKLHERLKIFVWRIGSNTLPTRLNVAKRTGFRDTTCPLCGNKEESYAHLFLQCTMVKPLWFGLSWGILPDRILAESCHDFLNLVIDPPICPRHIESPKLLKAQVSIQIALILECIWKI